MTAAELAQRLAQIRVEYRRKYEEAPAVFQRLKEVREAIRTFGPGALGKLDGVFTEQFPDAGKLPSSESMRTAAAVWARATAETLIAQYMHEVETSSGIDLVDLAAETHDRTEASFACDGSCAGNDLGDCSHTEKEKQV